MKAATLNDRLEREIERFAELEHLLSDPKISGDRAMLKSLSQEHSRLAPAVRSFQEYRGILSSIAEAQEILANEKDTELREMAELELSESQKKQEILRQEIEILLLPRNPSAGKPVIMEIRAGTGGEEAALFVGDLLRLYMRFAEKRGLKCETIALSETGIGGYKEAILSFEGHEAYDLLHQEGGAHRVQRIPVTESGGRIHTSAVTVAVMTEATEDEIDINEADLQIDVYRASGAGGQHVNKTESAVRITHMPTGLVVTCQDERSQLKNRAKAMRVLRARLAEKQAAEAHASQAAAKKEQVGSGDRSERIRTYNFPQGRVTDHRIGYTAYNLDALMGGDADDLLETLLNAERDTLMAAMDE